MLSHRNKPLDDALEHLVSVLGFDKSESGSELFLDTLYDAVRYVRKQARESHKNDFLFLDCTHVLSSELNRIIDGGVE